MIYVIEKKYLKDISYSNINMCEEFSEKSFIKDILINDTQTQIELCKERLKDKHYYLINCHYNKCINQLYKSINTNKITTELIENYLSSPQETEDYTFIYLLCKLFMRNRELMIVKKKYNKTIDKSQNYIMKPNQHSYILILNEYDRQYKYNTIIYRIKDKSVMKYLDTIPINKCIFTKNNKPITDQRQIIQKIKQSFTSQFNSEITENELYKMFKNDITEPIRKRHINNNIYDTLTDYTINDI